MSDSYHNDYSHISRTMLKLFRESRLEYHLTYVTGQRKPKEPNKPMLTGTVGHEILLKGRKLDELVLCYPGNCLNGNGGLIGARAEAFRNEHPNWICLKHEEYDGIEGFVKAVRSRDDIRQVLENATSKEKRFDAELDGLPCKCMPDIACDLGDYITVYDFKFSEKVDPISWRRTSKRLALWLQDAHYSRVLAKRFDKPVQFRFINVEIVPPHRIQWYWYPPASRELAFSEHRKDLLDLAACYDSGDWSDNWTSETELSPWDFRTEDEMVEVEQ